MQASLILTLSNLSLSTTKSPTRASRILIDPNLHTAAQPTNPTIEMEDEYQRAVLESRVTASQKELADFIASANAAKTSIPHTHKRRCCSHELATTTEQPNKRRYVTPRVRHRDNQGMYIDRRILTQPTASLTQGRRARPAPVFEPTG